MILFEKKYDGESIVDSYRDFSEAFDERFTPEMKAVPSDEHGFHKGTFKITIEWTPD